MFPQVRQLELAAIEALGKGEMDDMVMAKLRRQLEEANATKASAEQQMGELMPALTSLKQQLRVLAEEKSLAEEEFASLKRQVHTSTNYTLSIHPFNAPYRRSNDRCPQQHALSTRPFNTPFQHTLFI